MKPLVTEFHALDIKKLTQRWWLYPFSKYEWVWRTHKGTRTMSVTITVLTDSLQLCFPMGAERVQLSVQRVQLTHSLGPRGGKCRWFVCPTCHRRVGVLYHADGLPFRCRICCRLAYPSQYRSRDQSYGRQFRGLSEWERERLLEQRAREV